MDESILLSASKLVSMNYLKQGIEARNSYKSQLKDLIEKRKCPYEAWSESTIDYLLRDLSLMDSNNFSHTVGIGEREARIFSRLVSQRHYGFGHGIGRSGDLVEVQPKAAGSSLLYRLTNDLVLHIIKESGARSAKACILVPMATGMSITLCLLTFRQKRPNAKYVIWPRIDQKSCFKSILSAGFVPLIVENILEGDELRTDTKEIERLIEIHTPESIAALLTTTSCFAPRAIDKLEKVAEICKNQDVPHIINNAYGLQSSKCMHHIEQAARVGRVDAFIQSTDKNLMVPVGGAIIAGFDKQYLTEVSKTYPGRASASPIIDVFITILSMGLNKYNKLLQQRKEMKEYLEKELHIVASKFNLKVLTTRNNPISLALAVPAEFGIQLGSMLFLRGVTGTRMLSPNETKEIQGFKFQGWGTHHNDYPSSYLTAAACIGIEKKEIDVFIQRLQKCLRKLNQQSCIPATLCVEEDNPTKEVNHPDDN